jgi:hypothetical protein
MTASQMADGSHTLRIRLVDEVNRQFAFYRFLHFNLVQAKTRDPITQPIDCFNYRSMSGSAVIGG